MQKKLLLLACGVAAVFALLLSRPSPSVELDAGALDAGPFADEWDAWAEGDGGEEDDKDAGIEALFDGGLEPLLDGGPDPIPLPDDDAIPVPPSALEPPLARDEGMSR